MKTAIRIINWTTMLAAAILVIAYGRIWFA